MPEVSFPASEDSTTDLIGLGFDTSSSVSRMLTGGMCCEHGGRGCRYSTMSQPSEPQTFDWQMDGGGDTSWRGGSRAWIHDKPGRTRALGTTKTLAVWIPPESTSSAEVSPAKTSLSPDNEEGSCTKADDPTCSSSSPGSLSLFDPDGFSSRTYPVSSLQTAVGTSEQSLERWPTSGTAWPGGFSTHVSSECRSVDGVCSSSEPSLSEILEPPQNVPARYSLSARAAQGILRRAEKRGRELPNHLRTALMAVASPMPSPRITPGEET